MLPAPITSKNLERYGTQFLRIGSSEMQGYRPTMEDFHSIQPSLSEKHPNTAFFGVFDGHGGDRASAFLHKNLGKEVGKLDDPLNKDALAKCLQELDLEFLKGSKHSQHGSTSLFAVLEPQKSSTSDWKGIVSYLGDSRAIIVRSGGTCESLTKDHKPKDPEEKERVKAAGGAVVANRVDGHLAMSRAIGDKGEKDNPNLPMDEQKVIAVPDFTEFELHKGDSLLLFCDGITEQMTNKEVGAFVFDQLKEYDKKKESPDPALIMAKLSDKSLETQSGDNMTAIMVIATDGSDYEKKSEFIPGPYTAFKDSEIFKETYLADAKKFGYEGEELMALVKKTEDSKPKKGIKRPKGED